jgi:flagellar hook-length control protein FliK
MMPNIMSNAKPDSRPDPKAQVNPGNEDNFSRYLDKKVREERRERGNLVGVKSRSQAKEKSSAPANDVEDTDDTSTSAAAFLQQLLADLQDLAKKPGTEAGQWSFQLKNTDMLDKMAAQAGMNVADLAALKDQMKKDGAINLADIFALLEKQLESLQKPQEVSAPETDLPVLESILSRMGVDSDKLAELSAQSTGEQGKFNLAAYLQGLQSLPDDGSLKVVEVSDLELAQIYDMLASAGVSNGQLGEIFPEKIAAWQRDLAGLAPVADQTADKMGLERLQEILSQGITNVEDSKPKVNLPGFLQNLSDVLNQAGFVKTGVGFTPVVQESLTSAYQELQKMVDLAKVKVDKVSGIMNIKEGLAEQWQASGAAGAISATSAADDLGKTEIVESVLTAEEAVTSDTFLDETGHKNRNSDAENTLINTADPGQNARQAQPRMPVVARPPATQILQQFAMDQLSQGVTQALQRDEHHLTLTMYPKELGEVKVDLQIRNNHLAVSFVMDNHKVKEALEKNMEEFKENLNRQGYNLEACAVMVDQQHKDSDGTRQQFEAAWEQMNIDDGVARKIEASPLEESMRQLASLRSERWPESSISVFV